MMSDVHNIERNKELCERYPFLIVHNRWTDEIPEDYDYSYIEGIGEIPPGLEKLFLQMCEDIREPLIKADYLNEFRFSQIKEKYNTLRLYHNGCTNEVQSILDKYEYISQFICQKCGKPATCETCGWIASYCDECINKDWRTEKIEFEPVMHIRRFSKDGDKDEYIDCSDIWERLYR